MIHKGLTVLTLTTALLAVNIAAAQEVTVTGIGYDRDGAIRDASRVAVEQVVGTLIDSKTLMKNLVVEFDELKKKSQGYVNNIRVLSEETLASGEYRVKANINVDTNPNAELMNSLTMLMRLNDPRIAVVVLENDFDNQGRMYHNDDVETVLNNKLISMGFNHIVDADHIIKLYDAKFLNNIYEGRKGLSNVGTDNACEFLVLGKLDNTLSRVTVPNYTTGQMMNSSLINAKAKLNIKILRYDTGDIIGTFATEGAGVGDNNTRTANAAYEKAAVTAAENLQKTFRAFSAKLDQGGINVEVTVNNEREINALLADLRSLSEINDVYIRSQQGGKLVLTLDTEQKPHAVLNALRSRTRLRIVTEAQSANSLTLRIIPNNNRE